ncbi:MAG: type II secretion system protein [Pseudonocardiaceae bacterium]|nr:type II secretion system protein [Pseudonocardiaceae bacterium]
MTGGLSTFAAAASAAAVVGGVLLLVLAVRGTPPRPARPATRITRLMRLARQRRTRTLLLAGVGVAVMVTVVTRWPIAGVAAGVFTVAAPWLFGGRVVERARTNRIEALATWTESLRDTMSGAYGLEQVISATAHTAPAELAGPIDRMLGRVRAQVPLDAALVEFADELADPVGDLVVAALVESAQVRGPQLAEKLSYLARYARAKVEGRRRIEARMRPIQRDTKLIIGCTAGFMTFLLVFSRDFLRPYDTPVGQVVLLVVVAMIGIGFTWLRRLARTSPEPRLLVSRGQRR